jgi:hypothetical protein
MAEDAGQPPRDKADLLARIDASWTALQGFIDGTDPMKLTESRDAEGWSVKDHLSHIAAWERSMLYLLQGRPRHEGLGVDEQLYLDGGFNEINAAIHDQTTDRSLDEALADLRWTHEQLLDQIDRLTDADLRQTYSHFLPDEPGDETGEPILGRLAGNTYEHYDEHRDWMESIATQGE